jgi:PTH1 family peptidyl-tRNA hydrolase
MRVVVGLGNPGAKYAGTRHNVGFAVIEELARRVGVVLVEVGDGLRSADCRIANANVLLVEPGLYMNSSGEALALLQPPPVADEVIVVHDDLDLECGRIRVKRAGGTGGHRGLESIVARLGENFVRVRVGIGRPPLGEEAVTFVLSRFDAAESNLVARAVRRAADAIECTLERGVGAAMNIFNRWPEIDTAGLKEPIGRE